MEISKKLTVAQPHVVGGSSVYDNFKEVVSNACEGMGVLTGLVQADIEKTDPSIFHCFCTDFQEKVWSICAFLLQDLEQRWVSSCLNTLIKCLCLLASVSESEASRSRSQVCPSLLDGNSFQTELR